MASLEQKRSVAESPHFDAWFIQHREQFPQFGLTDATYELGQRACREIEVKYGAESAYHLAYHSLPHSLDVAHRALILLDIHNQAAPDSFDVSRDGNIVVAAGLLHDWEQRAGSGENERLSAKYAKDIVRRYDFSKSEAARIGRLINATVTDHTDGRLLQPVLRDPTNHDPLSLVLATADIDGIGMEGLSRMVQDAVNLAAERKGVSADELVHTDARAIADMLVGQLQFFGTRLDVVGDDLRAFYDEKTAEKIEDIYAHEFGGLGSEAIRAASKMAKFALHTQAIVSCVLDRGCHTAADLRSGVITEVKKIVRVD